jgi:hypothetical protein
VPICQLIRPGAEVVAVDGRGRPALLIRQVGSGSLVLCTYPIEHMAAITPRVNPEATSRLYGALAEHAGVARLIQVDDPRVAADLIVRTDGSRFAWLVSQADEPVTVKPELAAGLKLRRIDSQAVDEGDGRAVTLAPFGIGVFHLEGAPSPA